MGELQRRDRDLDADLERLVRTTGRAPVGAALVAFCGAGLVWAIGKSAAGGATVFDYGAALIIAVVVAPALALMGLEHRKRMRSWAHEQQVQRQPLPVKRPRRHTTDKRATLPRDEDAALRATRDGPP